MVTEEATSVELINSRSIADFEDICDAAYMAGFMTGRDALTDIFAASSAKIKTGKYKEAAHTILENLKKRYPHETRLTTVSPQSIGSDLPRFLHSTTGGQRLSVVALAFTGFRSKTEMTWSRSWPISRPRVCRPGPRPRTR